MDEEKSQHCLRFRTRTRRWNSAVITLWTVTFMTVFDFGHDTLAVVVTTVIMIQRRKSHEVRTLVDSGWFGWTYSSNNDDNRIKMSSLLGVAAGGPPARTGRGDLPNFFVLRGHSTHKHKVPLHPRNDFNALFVAAMASNTTPSSSTVPKATTSVAPSSLSSSGVTGVVSRTGTSGSSSTSSSNTHHNYDERLERVWRSLASSVVVATHKAENLATETKQKPPDQCKQSLKELDEAVITFLRTRLEYRRQLALVEAKLEGRAQELEALESCVRSQPRARKRKRDEHHHHADGGDDSHHQNLDTANILGEAGLGHF